MRAIKGRAFMIAKNRCGQPDRETDRHTDGHISSTGPHWVPKDPIVGIILIYVYIFIYTYNFHLVYY